VLPIGGKDPSPARVSFALANSVAGHEPGTPSVVRLPLPFPHPHRRLGPALYVPSVDRPFPSPLASIAASSATATSLCLPRQARGSSVGARLFP
ncbi:Phosphatidylinositol 4-kinase gamma 3, partial [Zea mays]